MTLRRIINPSLTEFVCSDHDPATTSCEPRLKPDGQKSPKSAEETYAAIRGICNYTLVQID